MKNPDEDRLTPRTTDFPHLERVAFQREIHCEGCLPWNLMLTFRNPYSATNPKRFIMKCDGVTDLRFGRLDGLLTLVVECRSVKEQQLEDLYYRVWETEEDMFSFYCKSITAEIL